MDKHAADFIVSLEELTCDDLAPPVKQRRPLSDILFRGVWILMVLFCLSVAVWSSAKVAESIYDFVTAEEKYNDLANEFSPITGTLDRPLRLKAGDGGYPIAAFDHMLAGEAVYPEDPLPPVDLPPVNPGTEPTPSGDPEPSPTPSKEPEPTPSKDPEPTPSMDPEPTPSKEPEPTPSMDPEPTPPQPSDPEPQPSEPQKEEDPLLSEEMHDQFCEKLTAMQGQYKNKDIFAWIYVPGTNINYPIVQSADNDYYLKRDVSKKWNTAGSIYMDYRNEKNLLKNPFTVIYGHNIRTKGTMFNRLIELLEDEEQYERCRYVYIYTREAALKYEIFSVYNSDASESPTLSIPTQNNATFLEKIKDIQNTSIHRPRTLTLYESDHVVLLYTCSNTQSSTERVYVAGVLVGIGT